MSKPCALFATCSKLTTSDIIKLFLGTSELPACRSLELGIMGYSWHIENKYYTADIDICAVETRNLVSSEFAELVEAFVVHFDPAQLSSFEQVKRWLPFLNELTPGIQMLLCDRLKDSDAVSFVDLQTWCVENTFELVELNPEEISEEEDFPDVLGIERVRQGLQAHAWPNLILREHPQIQSPYVRKLMQEINAAEHMEDNDDETNTPDDQRETSHICTAAPADINTSSFCENATDTSRTDEEKLAQLHADRCRDSTCDCMESSHGDAHCNCNVSTELSNVGTERSNVRSEISNVTTESLDINATADRIENGQDECVGGKCSDKSDSLTKATNSSLTNKNSISEGTSEEGISSSAGAPGAAGDASLDDSAAAAKNAGKSGGRKKKKKKQKSPASMKCAKDDSVNSDDLALFAALADDDLGEDSFEMMFERLRLMKEKAATLPAEERKAHAEKTVLSFWKAIGGDEAEIDGVMDSEDLGL